MKLTALIILTACITASAKSDAQIISLNVKEAPLEKVFAEIKKQASYSFVYYKDDLVKADKVTLKISNASIEDVLNQVFKNQPLTYTIVDKTIIVKQKQSNENATDNLSLTLPPPIDIHGRIVNEKNEPVIASIIVKGTTKGTSTNDNGEFELKGVDDNATLIISGVSIETFEVKVGGRSELALLNAKTKTIVGEEIKIEAVNTGYQKISKERFVGSYSQLDSAAYNRRAGMNIIDRLDGTVTGVLFDKKSGSADFLNNIQIRGLSTLAYASVQPLVIVDNFPFRQNINLLNSNDIESITVLKDAAATSIWGAQAGNGVIVITTKKGKYNQPLNISVTSNITVSERPNLYYYPKVLTSDIIDVEQRLFKLGRYDADLANTSNRVVVSPVVEILAQRRSGLISPADSAEQIDALRNLDYRRDLNKYVYQNAVTQQYFLNAAGGNNSFNYSLSGGYNRSLNGIKNSKHDDQYTLTTTAGLKITRNLDLSSSIVYNRTVHNSTNFIQPSKLFPYSRLADAEGNPLAVAQTRLNYVDTAGGGMLLDWRYRPLEEIKLNDDESLTQFVGVTMNLNYRFTSWLNLAASYQFNDQSLNETNIHSLRSYFTRNLINQFTNLSQADPGLRYPVPVGGIYDLFQSRSESQNARGQLNFNRTFAGKHRVTSMVATEVSETVSTGSSNRLYGYDKSTGSFKSNMDYATFFDTYGGIAGSRQIPNESRSFPKQTNRFVSFLGNLSYQYNNRYSIYASARKDGSNFFGLNTNRKWKPLWSVGTSWEVSGEDFYKIAWMPSLRLRASYGYSGNPGNISGVPTIIYSQAVNQVTGLTMAQINGAPNPDLRWEKVRMINLGADFGLLSNRITGSIDVYSKRVTDVISPVNFPPTSGVLNYTTNVASLKGNGFDLGINSKNIEGAFSWQTNFGLSHAKMLVDKLVPNNTGSYYQRADAFVNYSLNAAEGRLVYGLASYRWAGLDPATGNPRGYVNKQPTTNYDAIFADTVDNQVFHGSAIPLYYGFLTNTFGWKNFSVSANIGYKMDFYFRKPSIDYGELVQTLKGSADYYSRWQKSGDEQFTQVPSFAYPINTNRETFYQYSEVNVLRGDNIRLQDVRIQYTMTQNNLHFVKRLSVFLYVNNLNLILWRKNNYDLDPDFVNGQSDIIPPSKTWTAGFSLNL